MYQSGTRLLLLPAAFVLVASVTGCTGTRSDPSTSPAPGTAGTSSRRAVLELPVSESYERAVAQGTRTHAGAPGPKYWQQWADYKLEAELNPISKRVVGKGTITAKSTCSYSITSSLRDPGITPTCLGR
jgi:hypothetical protein